MLATWHRRARDKRTFSTSFKVTKPPRIEDLVKSAKGRRRQITNDTKEGGTSAAECPCAGILEKYPLTNGHVVECGGEKHVFAS